MVRLELPQIYICKYGQPNYFACKLIVGLTDFDLQGMAAWVLQDEPR